MELIKLHKNVKIRILDVFLNSLSSSMYFPFMGIYFASRFGAKLTGVLMIFTILFGFCAGLYAGYFSDLIGRKKIIVGAAFARFLGVLLMLLANTPMVHSTIITFIAVLIISACSGITGPVSEAMVIDVTTNENRKTVYSYMYWFNNLSRIFGAVIGGFLFSTHLFIILTISSVLSFVSVLLISFFITDTYTSTKELTVKSRWEVLKDIGLKYKSVSMDVTFMLFTLATLLFFTLEFQTSNYVGIRLAEELKFQNLLSLGSFQLNVDGTSMLGLLNAENTFLVVATTLIIGKMTKRFNGLSVLLFGLLIYTGGYFILSFSNVPIILLAAGFVATIGEIMFWPIRQAYLADLIPENARSSYMAVNSFVFRGASIIASLFITIGAFVSPIVISSLFVVIGLLSIWLFKVSIYKIRYSNNEKKLG
jgi:DHA1 family multidrug resistance protein B-like MFS transporter